MNKVNNTKTNSRTILVHKKVYSETGLYEQYLMLCQNKGKKLTTMQSTLLVEKVKTAALAGHLAIDLDGTNAARLLFASSTRLKKTTVLKEN